MDQQDRLQALESRRSQRLWESRSRPGGNDAGHWRYFAYMLTFHIDKTRELGPCLEHVEDLARGACDPRHKETTK